MSFSANWICPGVCHISDAMDVHMTLLAGRDQALLVDAGYGTEDVSAFVRGLTERPVTLMLTHAHHDHALGARWFERALMLEGEQKVYETYTADFWRRRVLASARGKGLAVDEQAFLDAVMPPPDTLRPGRWDLGGLSAVVIPCPGHTPGSAVVYVPEYRLLLSGDDWNPTTWLFFPEAVPIHTWLANMRRLCAEWNFRNVLCPHSPDLHPRERLEFFLSALTDQAIRAARPVPTGEWLGLHTAQVDISDGQCIVFDAEKARQA